VEREKRRKTIIDNEKKKLKASRTELSSSAESKVIKVRESSEGEV
jgi:hypothetical protein